MKSLRMAIIGVTISLLTIILIVKFTQTSLTWKLIWMADWKYLLLTVILQAVFWFLWGFRLKMIASYIGYQIPLGYACKISLASAFLATITPSSAGGEPLRVKMLADAGANYGEASAAVLAERVLDAIYFAIALPVFLFLSGISTSFGMKVAIIFIVSLAGFLLIFYRMFKSEEDIGRISRFFYKILSKIKGEEFGRKWSTRLENEMISFRRAAVELLRNPVHRIVLLLASTALLWTSIFLIPSLILLSLHSEPNFLLSYTAQLIIIVISLIPLTPGASGIAEAGAAYLYSMFVPQHILGVLIGLWRVMTYHLSMLVGFVVNIHLLKNYANAKQL